MLRDRPSQLRPEIGKSVVDRIRERRPVPNPYRVGDVCTLVIKGNPNLRGRGGQWCIVSAVHQFSCLVKVWDGEIQVKIENLKDLYYAPQQREMMHELCERLHQLQQGKLEGTILAVLASLGKIERPFLTPLEEKLLELLEAEKSANDN